MSYQAAYFQDYVGDKASAGSQDQSKALESLLCRISMEAQGMGALINNGGPTLTHAPLENSPVLDRGSAQVLVDLGIETDQRGNSRFVDHDLDGLAQPDIGAYEAAIDEFFASVAV